MMLKLMIFCLAVALIGAAPSPYPPVILPAHSYSSVVHYPSYAYKYPYYSSLYPGYLGYPYYKYPYYGYPGSIYPYYHI